MSFEKISDLYSNEISAAVQLMRGGVGRKSQKTPTILHFSDLHNSQRAMERILCFARECEWLITDILHTGDSVSKRFSDGMDAFSLPGAQNILNIVGNHDALNDESGWDWSKRTPTEALYDVIFEPYCHNWNVKIDENTTYWYKDYEQYYFRLIGIDSTLYDDSSQMEWLDSVLASALELEFSVVIATHYPPENRLKIPCGFTSSINEYLGTGKKGAMNEQIQDIVQRFINKGGEFICYLSGHTHTDYLWYNKNYPHQLCITIDSANAFYGSFWGDTYRIENTKSQDLFNLFSFDTQQKIIKIVRIGANVNAVMQLKNVIAINYKTMRTY